ncbi:NAD(P)-dependent oxidoreductase [Afifella sp. IM 167]|uniref:NAD-dependent epimerase/dehydratase family protein n=1 Tax=Afifella sp. IM 167 TaxID=2033586 RepID=UPI001CCBC548|nr:NAD(P)-dependent oxidoreductase [Afifella sp. IM 167]MBZ8134744.1 UDP-glucose 4-epimerase [Afifella sp. IM 167]
MSEAPLVLVTGGTGYVGQLVARHLAGAGYRIRLASRSRPPEGRFAFAEDWMPFDLDPQADFSGALSGVTHLVHAAFLHVPGRYRGGEGDDLAGFRRANVDGSLAFFAAAKRAGVARAVFLSSRAVYGRQPGPLEEDTPADPDTEYGRAKLEVEEALATMSAPLLHAGAPLSPLAADASPLAAPAVSLPEKDATPGFAGASLRVTGVYGLVEPLQRTKWFSLASEILDGTLEVAPRAATEVHGEDVGAAVRILMESDRAALAPRSFNCSDLLLTNAEIVRALRDALDIAGPVPEEGGKENVAAMRCDRLHALGWRPGSRALFERTVAELAARSGESRIH